MVGLLGAASDGWLVRLSHVQQRALKADARELLMRVSAAAGLLAGMWLALHKPAPGVPASCETTGKAQIGACFNDVLFSAALPYVLSIGAGLLVGGFVGWLVGSVLPKAEKGPVFIPVRRAQRRL
jgi:hypothetical protein